MKMFVKLKRVLACLLAVAMLMAVLTACGGGGGSGGTGGTSTSGLKLANTALATGGNVTLKGTFDGDTVEFGSNGTSTYFRETDADSDVVGLKTSSGIYSVDMNAENRTATDVSSDSTSQIVMGLTEAILNTKSNLANAKAGIISAGGSIYNSEEITTTVGGINFKIAYCFDDGGTLEYIVVFKDGSATAFMAIQVDSVTNSVDSSLLTTNGWINKNTSTSTGTVTVSVAASGTASGTVSGGGTYTKDTSVTVTATANTGYTFAGWQRNGSTVSTSASYTFTASESVTLTAVFEAQITWSYKDFFNKFTSNKFYFEGVVTSYKSNGTVEDGGVYTMIMTRDGNKVYISRHFNGEVYPMEEVFNMSSNRGYTDQGGDRHYCKEVDSEFSNASYYSYILCPPVGEVFTYGKNGDYDTISIGDGWKKYCFDSTGNLKLIKTYGYGYLNEVYKVTTYSPIPDTTLISEKFDELKARAEANTD